MHSDVSDIAESVTANPWAAWGAVAIAMAAILVAAFVVVWIFKAVTNRLGRRARVFAELNDRFPQPIFWLLVVVGAKATVVTLFPLEFATLQGALSYALDLGIIAVV